VRRGQLNFSVRRAEGFEVASSIQRVKVIGPTLSLMTLLVLWINGGIVALPGVTPAMAAVFLLGPYAGPFVGFWGPVIGFDADPPGYMLATGLPLLAMILSHPVYPRWWTGTLCVVGMVLWFGLSMGFIHQASA
jgi:hypothetical protein